ncbi:ABC transporter substrate-binding protein [Pseudolysinimonas sp.]|uniref:ABC transporter substrate-binding protein n=1 Tax=Pseudolysinimonas sp. TaxID=2680009 RepID=UPI003F81647F
MTGGRRWGLPIVLVAVAALLAGCAAGPSLGSTGIVIGTALPVTALDPAADQGAGGELVAEQIYPHLLTTKPGGDELVPDIARSARFDAAGAYVVTLKKDLLFANGDVLDARDVVHSFRRQTAIAAKGGPAPLLAGIASITMRDARTVVFQLKKPGDQGFPAILASPAGAIVDEQTFPATRLATDREILSARPFAGPYVLQSLNPGELLTFRADPAYAGALGAPVSPDITLKLYSDADSLAADVADRAIDLAYGGLGPAQTGRLRDDRLDLISEPGGSLRYLVFDFAEMPYGTKHSNDPKRALAVRTALADLVDRQDLADRVDAGATSPLYGFTSDDLPGASPVLRSMFGDGRGGPDSAEAGRVLRAAGVDTPVSLTITVVPDDAATGTLAEYEALQSQLQVGGLFNIVLSKVSPAVLATGREKGDVAAYQGGWSPRGRDPETYRAPYLVDDAHLGSHYTNPVALGLLARPATESDPTKRAADLLLVQQQLATDLPVLPLVQHRQLAATASGVTGVVFDGSLTLRFGSLRMP